jgi:hypothetical protein
MDRASALGELPVAYAIALRMADQGIDRATIAASLDVDPTALDNLLELARKKVEELLDQS